MCLSSELIIFILSLDLDESIKGENFLSFFFVPIVFNSLSEARKKYFRSIFQRDRKSVV